jgi:hypothetical protein
MGEKGDVVRYQRSPHVVWRRTLEVIVVLAVDGTEPLVLGGTAADVWTLLAEPRTLDDLVGVLAEHYSGEAGVIAADVAKLLATLCESGVVLSTAT